MPEKKRKSPGRKQNRQLVSKLTKRCQTVGSESKIPGISFIFQIRILHNRCPFEQAFIKLS